MTLIAFALVACGGDHTGLLASSGFTPPQPVISSGSSLPDATNNACDNAATDTPPQGAAGICFSGVDYVHATPGSIFQIRADGSVATLFQRRDGLLTSYAQAPDGTIYFTNAVNGTAVYKIDGLGESIVYQHSTWVRMVRVDSKGQVYFNEDTGAGGNGKIYELVNGVAQLFYEVQLGQVGGFWGDFGFDDDDMLWLSSSNEIPSRLYYVTNKGPQLAYVSRNTSFMGFRFLGKTEVLFAGQDHLLRLLDLCTGEVQTVYTVEGNLQTQDVNVCPAVSAVVQVYTNGSNPG